MCVSDFLLFSWMLNCVGLVFMNCMFLLTGATELEAEWKGRTWKHDTVQKKACYSSICFLQHWDENSKMMSKGRTFKTSTHICLHNIQIYQLKHSTIKYCILLLLCLASCSKELNAGIRAMYNVRCGKEYKIDRNHLCENKQACDWGDEGFTVGE